MGRKLLCLIAALLLFSMAAGLAEETRTAEEMEEQEEILTWKDTTLGSLVLVDRIHDEEAVWSFDPDAELLHIWFPRIHDCDAALIACGGEYALIDCCDEGQASRLANLIMAAKVPRIDWLFNTHPHHDHLGGLSAVADTVPVRQFLICFHEYYNERMQSALAVAKARMIPVVHYGDGDRFEIGSAQLQVFLKGEPDWSVNEQSAVMRLSLGERSMLFMADTQARTFNLLAAMEERGLMDVDIIKYPHHGVELLTESFLRACEPDFAVITNTDRVSEALALLDREGIAYALTAYSAVHLVTDGSVWVAELLDVEMEMRGSACPFLSRLAP